MSNGKSKASESKSGATPAKNAPPARAGAEKRPPAAPTPPSPPAKPAPLFRAIDWLTFGVTTLLVFTGYLLTLAPDLTLEDSGELAVGSYYAGIPHPPGYPIWAIYTWLFAHLVPISNIAYRVAMASAFAGALGSGLLAFMVSRGSSMMMEGIAELKTIDRRWENLICVVAGFVSGMLLGFNGYMWSQSVIVEVYSLSVVSLMGVLLFLLRWIYAPHQWRYLYLAFFLYGICFNNHQSLLVIVLGMEALVVVVQRKLARELFFGNTMVYLGGLVLGKLGFLAVLTSNTAVYVIFNIIGIASAAVWVWLAVTTRKRMIELGRDLLVVGVLAYGGLLFGAITNFITSFNSPSTLDKSSELLLLLNLAGLAACGACVWTILKTWSLSKEWLVAMGCWASSIVGAAFYLYMALAGMSNPPMQWGYPRVVEGFFHALTRGQYNRISPTVGTGDSVIEQFASWIVTYSKQLWMFVEGLTEEFSLVYLFVALVIFLYYRRMQARERAWTLGMIAIFLCLGPFLVVLLNPPPDRQARELIRVFFTASHVLVAMSVGYGITLLTASLATRPEAVRKWIPFGAFLALFAAMDTFCSAAFDVRVTGIATDGIRPALYGLILVICGGFFLFHHMTRGTGTLAGGVTTLVSGLCLGFIGVWEVLREKVNVIECARVVVNAMSDTLRMGDVTLKMYGGLFVLALVMVALILFLLKQARVVFILGLCSLMPVNSLLSHWFENEQRGHLFGYWFGHDMFTPPFTGPDGRLSYDAKLREEMMKDPEKAKLIYPEMTRDAVLYGGTDPGRFCPTYMIFCDSFVPPEKKKYTDPNFDRRDVYIITQNALADATYLCYIRAHYNRSTQLDPPFFQELLRGNKERELNYTTNFIARLAGRVLDRPFTALGDHIEKMRRAGPSYFKESDFADLPGFVAKLRPGPQQDALSKYLFENLDEPTRALVTGNAEEGRLRRGLAKDLNVLLERELLNRHRFESLVQQANSLAQQLSLNPSDNLRRQRDGYVKEITDLEQVGPLFQPDRFKHVKLSDRTQSFIRQNPRSHTRIRLNRLLLEEAYPRELARSNGGVYPDREIHTATPGELQQCFDHYLNDAKRRLSMNPPQLKPGEDVRIDKATGRVQVSGQTAVMAINALVTKVIFDQTPGHEFYVEESFPLDWMFPHLTPFGVIMKVNRQPLLELTDDILQKDHFFWSRYSARLIGDWVTYDTSVKDIVAFVEKVYLHHDLRGFKGDPKFVRDDQAQKAFSKLRSSIAGVYTWRIDETSRKLHDILSKPPAERQALQAEYERLGLEQARMVKEADFAFRQAFAFCPYSPEAVFRYAQLLSKLGRFDDALLVAETCKKLDPANGGVIDLVKNLQGAVQARPMPAQPQATLAQLEKQYREQPTNFQAAFDFAATLLQLQQTGQVVEILDKVLAHPLASRDAVLRIAQVYADMLIGPKLEATLERLVQVAPEMPEAWYDLAAIKVAMLKHPEALKALRHALELSAQRIARDPAAQNLRVVVQSDNRFTPIKASPEFQALTGTNN